MQNNSKSTLPRWVAALIIAVIIGHFSIITIYHFSRHFLPERLWYWTDHYVTPWFYQYFVAFAPDPPDKRLLVVYRTQTEGNWTRWQYPSFALLQDQWANRFHPSVKILDQVERMGDNFYTTVKRNGVRSDDATYPWDKNPTMITAFRLIRKQHPTEDFDSVQVALLIEKLSCMNDSLVKNDSLMLFPKYDWIEP